MNHKPLDRGQLRALLGPLAAAGPLSPEIESETSCDGYIRRRVSYAVPTGRTTAFVCVPDDLRKPVPLIFCHHQHAGQFDLGKSETCGLRGDPDLAYGKELAQRGYVTICPDAIGFEDRNWASGQNTGWFELSSRLVLGRTLLAECLQEISLAIDYATSLPEVDASRVGFIGHSYGGRAAIWAPAWDERITISVSNCGCIPYRDSFARDAGFQAEFVVPGFAAQYDVDDVLMVADQCSYLVIAAQDDRWSRGAADIAARLRVCGAEHVSVSIVPGGHRFPADQRRRAYETLTWSEPPAPIAPDQPNRIS